MKDGGHFLNWSEAFEAGAKSVGGKGWNLGRLQRYGFRIPMGGVLCGLAYNEFIESNNLQELIKEVSQSIKVENIGDKETEEKLDRLRVRMNAGVFSSHLIKEIMSKLDSMGILNSPSAVRSSATAEDSADASFAGVHDSFLNIQGLENILTAVKGCYASLWTARAVVYRRKMDIPDAMVVPAVIIMEMVDAKASGIAFTCDPQSGREDTLVVNANYGLGESVVGGAVDPDQYLLSSKWLLPKVTQKFIGRKEGITISKESGGTELIKSPESVAGTQVLSDKQIGQLGLLILRVYEALGQGEQHQDVEWVFDGKDFSLVQARPVTVLPRYTFPELKNQADIWSNANTRDAMPMVQSTLNAGILRYFIMSLLTPMYEKIGYRLPPGIMYPKLFKGRVYFNLSVAQWAAFDGFGSFPAELNAQLGGHQPEINIRDNRPFKGIKGLKRVFRRMKFLFIANKTLKKAEQAFDKACKHVAVLMKKDFRNIEDQEIVHIYNGIIENWEEFAVVFSILLGYSSASILMLVNELEKVFPGKGYSMFNAVMAGKGEITSAELGYRLVEMAEIARKDPDVRRFFSDDHYHPLFWETQIPGKSPFKQAFRDFIEEYGHRGIYELDIMNPRWREDPSYPLNIIRSLIDSADMATIGARQKAIAAKAEEKINHKLPFCKRVTIRYWLKQARIGAEVRELSKSFAVKISCEPFRKIALEVGARFKKRGIIGTENDIFYCAWPEIFSILLGQWDGNGLSTLITGRRDRREELEKLLPPDVIIDGVPHLTELIEYTAGDAFEGLGVAGGKGSGLARLICHPNEGEKLKSGDILIAPSTDPGWTPLFLKVNGIVMETGGYLSHGAIVAREYGVPAVVNIPGIMNIIKDGQQITVDGDEGKVYI